jgi:chromosomal replication initiator protein
VPCEEFTNDFVQAVRATTVDQFRARYRDVDVLVLDDVHFLINKKATQEEFLNTYNAIDAAGKMVVLTCDRHPRSLQALPEPLINRLIAAMTVEIGPPDYTVRREILRRRAASMQCELPEAVLDFLAARVVRNVRELEGALYKLAAVASLTREKLTLELVRRTVEDYMPAARAPEPPEFVRQCALYFGLTVDSLGSDSRDRTVTLARGLAMFLLRRHTKLSYPEIGRLLGHKQHSTEIIAVRRIQHQLDHDAAVTWRTAGGARDAPVRCLLDELEQRLLQ